MRRRPRRPVKTQCIGKRRFPNYRIAKKVARTGTAKRPHKCDICNGVHLTKTPRKGRI